MATPEVVLLLPLDEAVLAVHPDHDHRVLPVADQGFEVLHVHEEPGVPRDREDPPVGVGQLRPHRARQGEPHRAEAVRDEARVRGLALVVAGDPHLVGADVREHDVVRPEEPPHFPEDLLRLHRKAAVVPLHFEVVANRVAELAAFPDVEQRQPSGAVEAVVERLVDLPEGIRDVGLDVEHHRVVAVDLGRLEVDVDDPGRPVVVPEARCVLDEVVADAHHEVRRVERHVDVVAALKAHGEQAVRVRHRHRPLAHEGVDDADPGLVGEAPELAGGTLADGPVPGEDERALRLRDEVDGALHHLVVGARPPRLDRGHRRLVALFLGNVLGKLDEGRARLLRLRRLERLAHHLRHRARVPNRVRPLGDRPEHGDRVHVLVALLVQAPGAPLPDDAHQRRAVHVGVGDPGDEVRRPRPQGAEADPRLAGEAPVRVRGEGGGLLVPAEHEPDAAVHEREHHVRVLLARHAEDVGDALRFQAADKEVGCLHDWFPRFPAGRSSGCGLSASRPCRGQPSAVSARVAGVPRGDFAALVAELGAKGRGLPVGGKWRS